MYSLQEENELIHHAQAGNQSACAQLLAAYDGLIDHMRRRYQYTPTGKLLADDALSILHLAFMEAIRDFNPSLGTHFAAFLQSRLHAALYKAFKQTCKYHERTAHPSAPTEEDDHDFFALQESPRPTPERYLLAREEVANLLHQLTPQEKELLQLIYAQGLSQITAARILHISPQTLNKRKKRLQEHCLQIRENKNRP